MSNAQRFNECWTAVGRDLPRADGRPKVTGAATYTAEWDVAGLSYGAVVDSTVARGTVRSIDAREALADPARPIAEVCTALRVSKATRYRYVPAGARLRPSLPPPPCADPQQSVEPLAAG